jgi:dCMP deaminase
MTDWNRRFMDLAQHVSDWSKDPSTQAAAVIVDPDRRVVSFGYNGLPRKVQDLPERYDNRELKYKIILHAERNALLFARELLKGYTIYTYPMMPCATCASMIIQAGISTVIAPYGNNPRWQADFELSRQLFGEAGVDLHILEGAKP